MQSTTDIVWFINNFTSPGGGERWILEAERVFAQSKVRTHIMCINYSSKVLFDGKYSANVIELNSNSNNRYLTRLNYFKILYKYMKNVFTIKPQMIVVQGFVEYVMTLILSCFINQKYLIIDFGQVFQIPNNYIRQSQYYKKHIDYINSNLAECGESKINIVKLPLFYKALNELKGFLLYHSFKQSKYIFCLSNKVKKEIKVVYNKEAKIIRAGLRQNELKEFTNSNYDNSSVNPRPIILSVCRLVKHKRVDLCIEAMEILKGLNSNFIFNIGGSGPELGTLKDKVNKLDLGSHVVFLGYIDEEELINNYYNCEVFLTMDSADFDITPLYALALGKKVVIPKMMDLVDSEKQHNNIYYSNPTPSSIANNVNGAILKNGMDALKYNRFNLEKNTFEYNFKYMLNVINGC